MVPPPLKGHVTRGNFSCNLSRNKRCEISCKTDFTCNTPVLQPATATKCCVASCKKSRNILNFSQRCETSCCVWHIHCNLQRNFVKIRQSEPVFCSQEISSWRRKSCKQFPAGALQVAIKYCERVTPLCNLQCFSVVIVARQVARKIASCKMALKEYSCRKCFFRVGITMAFYAIQTYRALCFVLSSDLMYSVIPTTDVYYDPGGTPCKGSMTIRGGSSRKCYLSQAGGTVESRFLESPRETKIGSRNREFEKSKVASNDAKLLRYCFIRVGTFR